MALTDLTGTKWRFNGDLPFVQSGYYSVNFQSANSSYTSIEFTFASKPEFIRTLIYVDENYNQTMVYDFGWTNDNYRLIEITGGDDATNPDAIDFMQSNAEQIIEETVLPSFSDVEVTPHDGYITMTINGVDFNLKTAASVSLISFNIGTETYQAEEGMTWAEWVNSAYNTDGFVVQGDAISGTGLLTGTLIQYVVGTVVAPTDTIQSGYAYTLETGGSND